MKKKNFKNVDLNPVKNLIKQKVSSNKLSEKDIVAILDETRELYKDAPLTEADIMKIYNTMVEELDSNDKINKRSRIILKVVGIITIVTTALFIPTIIESVKYWSVALNSVSSTLTATTLILIYVYAINLIFSCLSSIIAGILMFLQKKLWAARFLYISIALVCAQLIVTTSLQGVSQNFIIELVCGIILMVVSVFVHPQLSLERKFYRRIKDLDTEIRAKEGRLGMAANPNKGYIELDFFNLFWIFVVGSIIGLLAEYAFHILFVWGLNPENWYNRAGLLFGPFSPIYGFGGLFMTLFLNRFRNTNPFLLFAYCTLIGGAFEYFVSWFLEVSFGIQAWDYTGYFLNINGRTCLLFAAMFGTMGFVWIKWLLPVFMKLINMIPWKWRYPITFVATAFMIVNCVMTLQAIDCWAQREAGKTTVTPIEKFYETNYNNDFMKKRFASMSFQQDKSSRENVEQAQK